MMNMMVYIMIHMLTNTMIYVLYGTVMYVMFGTLICVMFGSLKCHIHKESVPGSSSNDGVYNDSMMIYTTIIS